LRFNRALERERKKSQPDREKFQRELDRIMPPAKKPEDTEKQVTEKTSPEIFNRPKNAPIFSTKPEKIGNYIFDASEFEGSMVYGKDAKGLVVKAYDPKTMDVIGSASFVLVRKKGKNGDSWLESDDTKVQEKYRGKGIATAMYQYAKNLGNDIKPSPYKSTAGGEMWKAWGRDIFEDGSSPISGTTGLGYTWRFEAGREVPWKSDVEANTFIRVTDPAGKTVAGVWADLAGDSLAVEYSQVFDEELRGRGLYTDLLKSLSEHYAVTSDTDTNNAAVGIYRRLGADYDAGQARHTLRKQGVAEGLSQNQGQVRQTLNAWMNQDQQYKDPTQRKGFQAKVWPYIQQNINAILSDKGKDRLGGYPAAPYAAWLLVQHMDAYPQNQLTFLNWLEKSGLNPDGKLQFLKDRAAVNQWIAANANKPEYFINGKPLPNPTVNVRNPAMFKDAGIVATSREEALQNAQAAGNKLLVAAVQATNAQTQPSYKQGVAEDEHVPSSLKTMIDVGGIQLNVAVDGSEVIIRPIVDGYQAGYVVFDRDGSTLVPADLAIDEQFRGQGIAKTIYDYVKSLGFTIRRSSDQTKAGKHFWDKNRGEDSQVWEQTMTLEELDEACWKGYHKEGMKTMFGKRYPNCVKNEDVAEDLEQKYLWHGSRQKIDMLEPRQSVDTGGAAGSNQNAIYATSDPKVAIAMGLTTPGSDTGMFPNDPQMVLFKGNIRKGENVYLHKVPFNGPDGKPQFVQGGNSREFHTIFGVKGIKPVEIKAVPVDKYLNLIRQATPADLELQKKYMKQGVAEEKCPHCNGPMFSEEMINEKKDACYYKVKSRYKVWPSAYASGALVQCRKKGASNWGTKSESSILEGLEQTDEDLHKWFKEKWVRFGPDGKIRGDCARGDDSEGKPKCLPQSKAQNLGKKGRASAAARKRREDPNPERSGKAINVATKKKTSESSILQGISETKGLPMPGSYEQEYGPFKKKGGYRIMTLTSEQEELDEKWSDKYKRSIDCSHPKGFSQRAHCQGKKKK
jgi:GNAT superfamily N-acetyltransferase